MPINDCEATTWVKRRAHGSGEARPVGNAMEGVGQEYEVNQARNERGYFVCISRDKVTGRYAAIHEAMTRYYQQSGVDVDCYNAARYSRDLQRKPAVSRAEIDRIHAGRQPDRCEYLRWGGP